MSQSESSHINSPALARPLASGAHLWAFPGYAVFFLMLFAPSAYKGLKLVLLTLTGFIILAAILRRDGALRVSRPVLFWTAFLTTIGLFFCMLGIVRGHDGALPVLTVYFLYPWIYLLLVAGASDARIVRGLLAVIYAALIAIGIYGLIYVLYHAGIWPEGLYIDLGLGKAVGFHGGYMEYFMRNINGLIFLVPYAIGCLMLWPRKSAVFTAPIRRKWMVAGFLLGLTAVLLSGRRGLVLVVCVAPLVSLGVRYFLPEKNRLHPLRTVTIAVLGLASIFWVAGMMTGIRFDDFTQMFLSGFDFRHDLSANIRAQQFRGLVAAWLENPILGSGHGADLGVARGVPTNVFESTNLWSVNSWSYELQYVALLAHTGIIGVLAYGAGVFWVAWKCIAILRRGSALSYYLAPVVVGSASFMLATATNPYLLKYEFLWTIFLPVLFVNVSLLAADRVRSRRGDKSGEDAGGSEE